MYEIDEPLIFFGSAAKALGKGKIGGVIAPFRTADDPDVQGDFFTPSTDFGLDVTDKARVLYHHGWSKAWGKQKLAVCTMSLGDSGLMGELQLDVSQPAMKALYQRAERGELFFSTAPAMHVMDRRAVKGAQEITLWPVAEVSLTPNPVDKRARAAPMKALMDAAMKGEHLGEHVERHAAMAALGSMHGALLERINGHLYDGQKSKAEKLAACKGCLDEHHEAAMKTLKAMVPDSAGSSSMKARAERLIALG